MQPGEEAVERDQRAVRIFRAREVIDQHRHQFGEMRAREFTAQRAIVAREPAAHRLADFDRAAEAHRSQLVERFDVVGIGGKEQRAAQRFGRRRILEQARVVALHLAQMVEQGGGERVASGKAEEAGKAIERVAFSGQRVGLLVGNHLQPMLGNAQETIGRGEITRGPRY